METPTGSETPSRVGAVLGAVSARLIAAGATLAIRLFRRRSEAGAIAIGESLPVHYDWWRGNADEPGDLLYVAMGDSAAQGIGASVPWHSYVGIIADRIRTVTGRSVRVVNLSISGSTVLLAAQDQLPAFRALEPDVVTLAIGANDIGDFEADGFEAGLTEIFDALPSHAMVADLPYFYLPHNERTVAVANRIVRRLAEARGITVVPLHRTTRRQGLRGIATMFAQDLFHPNDHGYRIWASAFEPTLTANLVARLPLANED